MRHHGIRHQSGADGIARWIAPVDRHVLLRCEGETPSRQPAGRRRYELKLRSDDRRLTTDDCFACIFVPDFPVEALLRAEPELRPQALAVLEGKAPLQTVFALNEKARHAGVSAGMTKLQVEACPDLVLRPRSLLQEAAAHAALLDCAQSFSPRVEDAGCDTVLLDLAGLEPLFGPLPKIARDVARRASDLGLEANVAVASNPDTAVLAALGFSGVIVIPEGKEAEQLGNLPLEVLFAGGHDPQTLEMLERWGIRNLRALAALPEIALSERLGQEGIRLQQLARGCSSRSLVPVEPPLVFEEAIELEYPLVLLEPLAFLLGRLLDQLCARLGARALATQELNLYPGHWKMRPRPRGDGRPCPSRSSASSTKFPPHPAPARPAAGRQNFPQTAAA